MNEASRLAYLEAMDINSYSSRYDLPGALASRRVTLVQAAPERAASASPAIGAGDLLRLAAGAEKQAASTPVVSTGAASTGATSTGAASTAAESTGAESTAAASTASDEFPIFSLLVSSAGGFLWIDAIPPGRQPGPEYAHLLESICIALGLSAGEVAVRQFNFPDPAHPGLGRDMTAARGALSGFLGRHVEQARPPAVLLMGDVDHPWFDAEALGDCRRLATVSAWRLLREPQLKPTAWKALQALRGNGG